MSLEPGVQAFATRVAAVLGRMGTGIFIGTLRILILQALEDQEIFC